LRTTFSSARGAATGFGAGFSGGGFKPLSKVITGLDGESPSPKALIATEVTSVDTA
jgi:hypothetical protein